MASQPRYARVDAPEQEDEAIRPSATPLQYSNSLSEPTQPSVPLTASWTSKKSFFTKTLEIDPNLSGEIPPYRDYLQVDLNGERPHRPKRVRTTGSFISVASSAWRSTKDFAVSNFNVPQLGAPWEHEVREKSIGGGDLNNSTVREFDYRRQRRRLFMNSSFQLLTTVALCALLAGALYGFSTIAAGLSRSEKKTFNALITMISILLGLNLASSLKSYAQMMRWRFLASSYRTLQDFELVLQCEAQSKVFRLLWAGRTRGQWWPNKTQVLAFVWLGINVALQVATALLGLTYSIDISDTNVHNVWGSVSVADLQKLTLPTSNDDDFNVQAALANNLGITGQTYANETSTLDAYIGQEETYYQNSAMTQYWYAFIDRSPIDWSENVISTRKAITTATCTSLPITFGGYAGWDEQYDDQGNWSGDYIHFTDEQGKDEILYVDEYASGATTYFSYMTKDCGARCAFMYALQSADNATVLKPALFQCNNTVDHILNYEDYGDADMYDMPNYQAHIMAGAIAWSGITTDTYDYQSTVYPADVLWSPLGGVSDLDMARLIMEFTTGAFAALDYDGQRTNVTGAWQPTEAQVVDVEWKWVAVVLAVIPATQAMVLICVIGWANKAVIKDTSFLGAARLLAPVVNRLDDRGCLLTGDEIAEELGNYRIIYGPRLPSDVGPGGEEGVVKHIDVIAEEEDKPRWHGRMPAGRYDGRSTWKRKEEVVAEVEIVEGEGKKRRGRRMSV